jgi:malonyl-CoA O-methyltransferase
VTDPFRLEQQAIRASFERASGTYDEAAVLQARVRQELVERLALVQLTPSVILDLGSGTGRAAPSLAGRYPDAFIAALDLAPSMLRKAATHASAVCADAARLPFAANSVDVVFSNLMLQWCEEPDVVFGEVRRILKPGGFFAFTTFGPDTLHELRAAWSAADGFSHVHRFIDMHDIGDALVRAGLSEPVMDVERVQLTYADPVALMRDLKAIGAHNATSGRARGLTGRARFARMTSAYEAWREDGRLPATYEVIYGAAWGAGERDAAPAVGGEARIPIGAIRRRRP